MEIVKQGFTTSYEVLGNDFEVKSTGAGNFNGNAFKASCTLMSKNVYETKNDATEAINDVVENVSFRIRCENDGEAGALNDHFRKMRKTGEVIKLDGSLPDANGRVDVFNTVRELMGLKEEKTDTKADNKKTVGAS